MRLLAREDEDVNVAETAEDDLRPPPLGWRWTAGVALIAAIPRLLYLFVFNDPENPGLGVYDDVWHHWQIAYLTKEIGLSAPDGPRLWDLKGLDYFWGVLHPLVMVVVFTVTGSIDIVLLRLVSIVFGVLGVVLIFHICRRTWSLPVAVAAAALAGLLPTSVMNDASGMLEPMGVALCLAGIWYWIDGRPARSGVAFGLASMARAEAWIFGLGLVIAATTGRLNRRGRAGLWFGFAGTLGVYMIVLLAKTGNPIYPLWWNFFANALGGWGTGITPAQSAVRPVLAIALVLSAAGLVWTLKARPRGHMLLTFGFGYWVFSAGMLGFTSFLSTWQWWMPISRRFEFPYEFVAVMFAVGVLRFIPTRLAWTALVTALVAVQLAWLPIAAAFGPTEKAWQASAADASQLGLIYNRAPYEGHRIAVPDDRPDITYGLARFSNVEGKHLLSEMYDPFAYLPSGYSVAGNPTVVGTLVQCWLSSSDVRLIAIPANDSNLALVVQQNPDWFTQVGFLPDTRWTVDAVSVPQPSGAACHAAQAAVQAS